MIGSTRSPKSIEQELPELLRKLPPDIAVMLREQVSALDDETRLHFFAALSRAHAAYDADNFPAFELAFMSFGYGAYSRLVWDMLHALESGR